MKAGLRRWLGAGAITIVLGLIVFHLHSSPEWRTFKWGEVWRSFTEARPSFLLAAVGATLASYLVRAYRWKFLLDPVKKNSSLWVLFVGQILGFTAVYLIGRLGELVRPAYIARKEQVPVSAMLAVWLLERIYDTVFMVLLFLLSVHLARFQVSGPNAEGILRTLHYGSLLVGAGVVGLIFLHRRTQNLSELIARACRSFPPRFQGRLRDICHSFAEGLGVIRSGKDLLAGSISTALLWFVNVSMVWLVFRSLGTQLADLTWMAAATVMFCAALGLLAQLPVLGGGYQAAAIMALTQFFDVPKETATGTAIVLWVVMLVPCLALGLVFLLAEGLSLKKLGAMARDNEAEIAGRHARLRG